ncbi:MAG: hypothetical protein ACQCN3_04525 [Candidatus Bathyarchaeia archaeon]
MSKKPQSKDEALEALDFIVNVLKEHEKDLDRLISELGNVTEQIGETGQINGKVENIDEKIGTLQNEVTNLLYCIAKQNNIPAPEAINNNDASKNQAADISTLLAPPTATISSAGPFFAPAVPSETSIIFRCKNWEDFQVLARQAQTISFTCKEAEPVFKVDALRGNQVITYSGELPKMSCLLKMYLSKQLEVSEQRVLEGVLSIS